MTAELHAPAIPTLGSMLERSRLEHRRRRTEQVLRALQDRMVASSSDGAGDVQRLLEQALAGFTDELAEIRRQLAALPPLG